MLPINFGVSRMKVKDKAAAGAYLGLFWNKKSRYCDDPGVVGVCHSCWHLCWCWRNKLQHWTYICVITSDIYLKLRT